MALNEAVISEGCPISFIGGLSNEFYRRIIQQMLSEGCPMNVIRGFPMSFIGGLSNRFISKGCPMGFPIEGSSNGFQKQKYFVLKTVFIHGKCICEGVGEDSRHGTWHVDIHVEMSMFYLNGCECVNHDIACALRWEVTLVGEFLY